MADHELTPLGRLVEDARTQSLGISAREAARRAGISSARWRQVVTGFQPKAGGTVPVNPTARTVIAMALAVDVDPTAALEAAGQEINPRAVESLVADVRRRMVASLDDTGPADGLVDEVERIRGLRSIPPGDRIRMVRALVALYEEQAQAC
jgi:transcriptional regulator with XRE-family HTH domain